MPASIAARARRTTSSQVFASAPMEKPMALLRSSIWRSSGGWLRSWVPSTSFPVAIP
jgi:hypothetical protein